MRSEHLLLNGKRIKSAGFDLRLVRIQESDLPFLFRLYASTRKEEMDLTNWTDEEKISFLEMQFNFQHHHYITSYPGAQLDKIIVNGKDAGRLYVYRTDKTILVIDIALVPEFHHCGIGSICMQQLMDEAGQKNQSVRLHVERFNPAQEFYKKLGFVVIEDQDVYLFLEWKPYEIL
ncbi:MAG TPA: GNAT family N-acetyltransferase [bacterium]|nr:GNAT family N-acetyltransferase [bacterium]HPN44682.1 GNAT family N-acetyltransferase [bacterium]